MTMRSRTSGLAVSGRRHVPHRQQERSPDGRLDAIVIRAGDLLIPLCHRHQRGGFRHDFAQAPRERDRVSRRHETIWRQQFGNAADGGRHRGEAARHRFEQRPRQAFGKRGQHEHIGSIEGALHTLSIELTEEFDVGRDAQRLRLRLQFPHQRAAADDEQLHLPPRAAQFTDRVEEYRDSFVGLIEGSDGDQRERSVLAGVSTAARR